MALLRPGFGPGPQSGGATPPTPPAGIGGSPPPGPLGGPAWRVPGGLDLSHMPGNLGAGSGHPASFYQNIPAGHGYEIQGAGTPPHHLQLVNHMTGVTADGRPVGGGPPSWWPQGAAWPPPVPWRGGGGDPYGPPVAPPPGPTGPPVAPPPPPHYVGPPVQPPSGLQAWLQSLGA